MTMINTLFWITISLISAYGVRILPKKFYYTCKLFQHKKFERKIYKTIKIKNWKTKVPELGILLGFQKRYLEKDINKEYLEKFIMESYYAELGHYLMGLLGFLIIFVNPPEYLIFSLICSVLNLFGNLPFSLIQRYNRPRLVRILNRIEKI